MLTLLDLKNVKEVLLAMADYEEVISSLYQVCAKQWPADGDLWDQMEKEELQHAERIRWMSQLLEENPRQFEIGRSFNKMAVSTAISGVKKYIEEIEKGNCAREKAMIIARDIEQSILESRYMEMLRTSNVEYLNIMKGIMQDTGRHRQAIQRKLEEIKK